MTGGTALSPSPLSPSGTGLHLGRRLPRKGLGEKAPAVQTCSSREPSSLRAGDGTTGTRATAGGRGPCGRSSPSSPRVVPGVLLRGPGACTTFRLEASPPPGVLTARGTERRRLTSLPATGMFEGSVSPTRPASTPRVSGQWPGGRCSSGDPMPPGAPATRRSISRQRHTGHSFTPTL